MQEVCTCDIVETLEDSASTISHHLRKLEDGGLITSRQVGKFTVYTIIRKNGFQSNDTYAIPA